MTLEDILGAAFVEPHRDLPRQGPGNDGSTLRALAMCTELPRRPAILDIGCGPGVQTLDLAGATDGPITAVDVHEPYLEQLRASARAAGVADRITPVPADMGALPFAPGSFDLIWCEGAAFVIGIDVALERWRPLMRSGGYLAFSDLMWMTPDVPAEAFEFFDAFDPGIRDVPANLKRVEAAGYAVVGHFTLPDAAWWAYLDPLSERIPDALERYADDEESLATVRLAAEEATMRRAYPDAYGYEFIVARQG